MPATESATKLRSSSSLRPSTTRTLPRPADVAGLDEYELVTEVNGEKGTGAKDFAAKVKGKKDLIFAVRHLAQTRMVKIHVEPDDDAAKDKGEKSK